MDENKVVSIDKNKEPDIDTRGFISKQIESFPLLERDILRLSLGLGESYEIMHTNDEIAEILNETKETIQINWSNGMQRLRDVSQKEKLRQENEDAYNLAQKSKVCICTHSNLSSLCWTRDSALHENVESFRKFVSFVPESLRKFPEKP